MPGPPSTRRGGVTSRRVWLPHLRPGVAGEAQPNALMSAGVRHDLEAPRASPHRDGPRHPRYGSAGDTRWRTLRFVRVRTASLELGHAASLDSRRTTTGPTEGPYGFTGTLPRRATYDRGSAYAVSLGTAGSRKTPSGRRMCVLRAAECSVHGVTTHRRPRCGARGRPWPGGEPLFGPYVPSAVSASSMSSSPSARASPIDSLSASVSLEYSSMCGGSRVVRGDPSSR